MAAPPLMRSLSTRAVKKLEKPRPLKISASQSKISSEPSPKVPLQDLMMLVDSVSQCLLDRSYDNTIGSNIAVMHSKIKVHGQQLEVIFKDQLDRAFAIFRDGCQDDGLICSARLHLLELVELRANHWSNCDNTLNYYSAKMATTEMEPIVIPPATDNIAVTAPSPPMPPVLNPGEVLKTSGKFPKPTKIPGKNYCKDEVVIRNSDSGKVNPGAKERLVQITGPSEDKIIHARQLMEETIRRNASPVREGHERHGREIGGSSSSLNSSASDESNRHSGSRRSILHSFSTNDASLGEYKYTVTLGHDVVKIIGSNHETVRNARLVLEEFYDLWLQKNCVGDCYGIDEDVFMDQMQDMSISRLNSVDSVATTDPGLGYSAMYSPSQPEMRGVLGRSNSVPLSIPSPPQNQVCRKYSREFLLECALSHHSRVTPPNWDQLATEYPAIAKKAGSPFDPKAFPKQASLTTAVTTSTKDSNSDGEWD